MSRVASSRMVVAAAIAILASSLAAPAHADDPAPNAERLRSAAEEYDTGRRSYLAGDFAEAATHFENAFHDAPRAEALRNAIRARRSAKQFARAATLASFGAAKYPDDAATIAIVNETLNEAAPRLFALSLTCSPACGVAADARVVSIADADVTKVYLEPGKHDVVVSWPGDRTKEIAIDAKAGGHEERSFEAPAAPSTPAPIVTAPAPVLSPTPAPIGTRREAPERSKPLGPGVFVTLASLTAVGIAGSIVSGIETVNNPGTAAVKQDCVGQGTSCAEYQKGRDAQTRTNVILGATAGVAVITGIVGLFLTDWSSSKTSASQPLRPYAGLENHAGSLGITGSF